MASLAIVVARGSAAGIDWGLVRIYFVELPLATGGARGRRPTRAPRRSSCLRRPGRLVHRADGRPRAGSTAAPVASAGVACAARAVSGVDADVRGFVRVTLNEPSQGIPLSSRASASSTSRSFGRCPRPLVGLALTSPSRRLRLVAIIVAACGLELQRPGQRAAVGQRSRLQRRIASRADLPTGCRSCASRFPSGTRGFTRGTSAVSSAYSSRRPGSFLLIGDTTILNGLTGKPSVFPALYLAAGPHDSRSEGHRELAAFEERLRDRLEAGGPASGDRAAHVGGREARGPCRACER